MVEKSRDVKVSKAALNRIIRQNSELKELINLIIERQKDVGKVLLYVAEKIEIHEENKI